MSANLKPYDLEFEEREGYLYAHLQAYVLDVPTAGLYHQELAERLAATGLGRLMIYREVPGAMTVGLAYFLADNLIRLLPSTKIAFVNPYNSHRENLEFAATVAKNRGGRHAIFSTVEEAEAWLLS